MNGDLLPLNVLTQLERYLYGIVIDGEDLSGCGRAATDSASVAECEKRAKEGCGLDSANQDRCFIILRVDRTPLRSRCIHMKLPKNSRLKSMRR